MIIFRAQTNILLFEYSENIRIIEYHYISGIRIFVSVVLRNEQTSYSDVT